MRYQQEIKGRRLSPLAGIGVIALIVFSIMAASVLEQLLLQMTGFAYGSIIVWGLVVVEAVFVMRLSVMGSFYRLEEDTLYIDRKYGDHIRNMLTIPLNTVIEVGPDQEILKKYGNGQAYDKLLTRGCPIAPSALAYRKNGNVCLVTFQPDEKLLSLLAQRSDAKGDDRKSEPSSVASDQ